MSRRGWRRRKRSIEAPHANEEPLLERGLNLYGVRIILAGPDPDSLGRVADLLPPDLRETQPSPLDPQFTLLRDGVSWRVHGPDGPGGLYNDLDLAAESVEAELRAWVADNAVDYSFVHAGVVALSGQAIVIAGESFSGKTRLVAELVRGGATYYSDEYAVLDRAGLVHPFARPLSVRDADSLVRQRPSAEDLGGVTGVEPLPIGMIVATSYRPEATFAPTELSSAQGALALMANSALASTEPRRALEIMRNASASALALEGDRGEASEAALTIREIAQTNLPRRRAPQVSTPGPAVGAHDIGMLVFGTRLRVEIPSQALIERVLEQFPRYATRCEPFPDDPTISLAPSPDGDFAVLRNGRMMGPSQALDHTLARLEHELFHFAVHNAQDHLVISAAVVEVNGLGICLPGVPKSGKTALMGELLKRGARYYSDDWGVFDQQGMILPYPTTFLHEGERISPAEIGAEIGTEPLRLGLMARLAYVEGGEWRLHEHGRNDAERALVWHSYGRGHPEAAHDIAHRAAEGIRYFSGNRGEASEAAERLLALAGQVFSERLR